MRCDLKQVLTTIGIGAAGTCCPRARAIAAPSAEPLAGPPIPPGCIFTGATTPTEAGVIACAYALFLGFFVYREIGIKDMWPILAETVEATAVPVYIIAAGSVFGVALTTSGFGFMVQDALRGLTADPITFLFLVAASLWPRSSWLSASSWKEPLPC